MSQENISNLIEYSFLVSTEFKIITIHFTIHTKVPSTKAFCSIKQGKITIL